jgi:hypothetical protein
MVDIRSMKGAIEAELAHSERCKKSGAGDGNRTKFSFPVSSGRCSLKDRLQTRVRAEPIGMERVKGIEPSYAAWEAAVLPLNYTRIGADISAVCPNLQEHKRAAPSEKSGFALSYAQNIWPHKRHERSPGSLDQPISHPLKCLESLSPCA